jgi:hypothetical protein
MGEFSTLEGAVLDTVIVLVQLRGMEQIQSRKIELCSILAELVLIYSGFLWLIEFHPTALVDIICRSSMSGGEQRVLTKCFPGQRKERLIDWSVFVLRFGLGPRRGSNLYRSTLTLCSKGVFFVCF